MDYGKREAGGIWILYSHNPLISDLGYFVTRDFFKSFLGCKDLFICKDLFLILTANRAGSFVRFISSNKLKHQKNDQAFYPHAKQWAHHS